MPFSPTLNRRVTEIPPSMSLGIASRAKALRAEGKTVCNLAAGEPDFDTPEHIKQAALKAMSDGATKYSPVAGLRELRDAIVDKLSAENGLTYTAEQVVVTNGAKQALFNTVMALCNPGSEVIIPSPYWLSYPEMVKMAEAVPVFVACSEDHQFKLQPPDLEAAITEKTVAVLLNTPSNPIGTAYSAGELKALADVAVRHGLTIISDEVYEKIVYDGFEHVSVASLSSDIYQRTVTVNAFSKAYAMTGWRLGYLAGPSALVEAISALQSHTTSGANTFAQHGAIMALNGPQAEVETMVRAFTERRDVLYARLQALCGVTCVKPRGAFYMFPTIASTGLDSVTFCERLIDEAGVAAVPGAAFGSDANIRLSYACDMGTIRDAMDRLETFIASL